VLILYVAFGIQDKSRGICDNLVKPLDLLVWIHKNVEFPAARGSEGFHLGNTPWIILIDCHNGQPLLLQFLVNVPYVIEFNEARLAPGRPEVNDDRTFAKEAVENDFPFVDVLERKTRSLLRRFLSIDQRKNEKNTK